MVNDEKIRVSKEFKQVVDYIRAKCLLYEKRCPSIPEITLKIAQRINKDEVYENEFSRQ